MPILKSPKKIEIEVLGVIILVVILNGFIFAGLDSQTNNLHNILQILILGSFAYSVFLLLSIVFIFLNKKAYVKWIFFGLLGFMTVHILLNLYFLINDPKISDNGIAILKDAFMIWFTNVLVFSLWFWILDRGGPVTRDLESEETRYDLLFPQHQAKIPGWEGWKPKFLDYLFFSFFTSTSFASADSLPLTKRVKILIMLEVTTSLVIIGMVASRAISLLH
jgi:hypothetical protein